MARGDWEVAVDYFTQALALDEELGRKAGMATQYGNLGARRRQARADLVMPRLIITTKLLPWTRSWEARRGWQRSMATLAMLP